MTHSASHSHVETVTQHTFQAFLRQRSKVIIRIGSGSTATSFMTGIVSHFSAALGDDMAFGAFDTSTLLYPPWLMKFVGANWQSAPPSSAPDGYYLFVDGTARGFHPGTIGVNTDAALATLGVAGLISLISESSIPIGAASRMINDAYARGVIAFFEGILSAPPTPKFSFDGSRVDWSKLFDGLKPKKEDPYATLGIASSATREEVNRAHREKSASVHPDKVATLAPELQMFANDLFVRVQAAHAEIKVMRGWN